MTHRCLLAAVLPLLAGCREAPASTLHETEPAAPRASAHVALLDRLGEAELRGAPRPLESEAETTRVVFGFEEGEPGPPFFARVRGRSLVWEEAGERVGVDATGGRGGGGLRLGPRLPEDRSRAVFLLDAAPLARVVVNGRVRIEGNPGSDDSSAREALRVVERPRRPEHPRDVSGSDRRASVTHRVSRRLDPSGWDVFELELVTAATTSALELQLLHRSGGAAEATTTFDDVAVAVTPLGEAELLAHVRARLGAEGDGASGSDSEAEAWRVRAELPSSDRRRAEVRDAVLLAPPMELAVPLDVPEGAPRLRLLLGMPDEAAEAPGDGARLSVRFEPAEGGAALALGNYDLDPKNDRGQRRWHPVAFDLAPVAGRSGALVLAAEDAPGTEPDPLDLLLVSTPRVEAPKEEGDAGPERLNVLLIGVDTLRADRLSAFGYERDTTPHLADLADASVRFASARSQAPWTLPSFSSILTSLYPSRHGAGRGGHDEWTPIDPTTTSIAEVLRAEGWETQGLVANGLISPAYGLDQGFEGYGSSWGFESATRDAEVVAGWIGEHWATPWLFFWHIMDPHLPYSTPKEVREAFADPAYDGRFSRGRSGPEVPFHDLDPRPGRRWFTHEGPPPPPELTEADTRFVSDAYDAELFEMDSAVGRVLAALHKSGQWERTVIAFVADHGEGLGDHGHYHHGYTLFEDQVHVPLIVRVPGRFEARVVERPVAAIDLGPTVLGALGVAVPDGWQGVDRLAPDAPLDDAYVIEYPTYDSSAEKAWVFDRFKYVHDPWFRTSALYDLAADPGETTDVAAQHPLVVARARAELDAFRWRELQRGRYHLRVTASPGARLFLEVTTDDLFDAGFAARPAPPEEDFALDLDRRTLMLETTLDEGRLELVFWCRGTRLALDGALDGAPLPGGLDVGLTGEGEDLPATLLRGGIPELAGEALPWPPAGAALLWLEAGVAPDAPVLLTPEQLEVLEALGYAR